MFVDNDRINFRRLFIEPAFLSIDAPTSFKQHFELITKTRAYSEQDIRNVLQFIERATII
jgi:hypothetical protein